MTLKSRILTAIANTSAAEPFASPGAQQDKWAEELALAIPTPLLHVQEETTGAGGTFTQDAWQTRVLDTVVTNEIVGATLSSNEVSLPTGTYDAEWSAPAVGVDEHITRLYDDTNTAELGRGTAEFTSQVSAPPYNQTRSSGAVRFILAGTASIILQHACDSTFTTNGLGADAVTAILNVSGNNVFAILKIWQVG